jgi:hypothetical protein
MYDWCQKYELLDDTAERLIGLRWNMKSDLGQLKARDWKPAGFMRLEWGEVLKAHKKWKQGK